MTLNADLYRLLSAPLVVLALAAFSPRAKELVQMGGSIHWATNDPELAAMPHREFNSWMDPEASRRALRSAWRRIVATTVDVSVKTRMDETLIAAIAKGKTPAAQYVAKYSSADYLWDEIAAIAWLDPSIITRTVRLYMDVSIEHDATYGDTLTWAPGNKSLAGRSSRSRRISTERNSIRNSWI